MEDDDAEELDPENFVKPTQESLDVVFGQIDNIRICKWRLVERHFQPHVLLTIYDRPGIRAVHRFEYSRL